jgi:hypothetical protein
MKESWSDFVRAQRDAITVFVKGNSGPYKDLWSHAADVSILGAFGGYEVGWSVVGARLDWAAAQYHGGWTFADETIAEGMSGEMGFRVSLERMRGRGANGAEVVRERRVTHVVRLESGRWRIVHHHSDPLLLKQAPVDIASPNP